MIYYRLLASTFSLYSDLWLVRFVPIQGVKEIKSLRFSFFESFESQASKVVRQRQIHQLADQLIAHKSYITKQTGSFSSLFAKLAHQITYELLHSRDPSWVMTDETWHNYFAVFPVYWVVWKWAETSSRFHVHNAQTIWSLRLIAACFGPTARAEYTLNVSKRLQNPSSVALEPRTEIAGNNDVLGAQICGFESQCC